MKRMLVLSGLAFVMGCRSEPPATITPEQRSQVVDSVTAAMHAYAAAFVTRDAEAAIRFYVNAPDFRMYDGGTPATYSELTGAIRGMMPGYKAIEGYFDDIQVTVLGPTAAVATSPFRDVYRDTAGVITRVRGTVSWTWVRRSDGWRIMHGNALHLPDTVAKKP